jgi:hypothetical protein
MRLLFRWLRLVGDLKAASKGPGAYGWRLVRRRAHRTLSTLMRRKGL